MTRGSIKEADQKSIRGASATVIELYKSELRLIGMNRIMEKTCTIQNPIATLIWRRNLFIADQLGRFGCSEITRILYLS
jgi:hypothetical protein